MKPLTPEIVYSRATVKAWERLRLLFNGILLLPGVALLLRTINLHAALEENHEAVFGGTGFYPSGDPLLLVAYAFIFGFVANICYCLGPYLEFVMSALGFPLTGQRTRYLVFGLGVLLSLAVMGLGWLYVEYYYVTSLVPEL